MKEDLSEKSDPASLLTAAERLIKVDQSIRLHAWYVLVVLVNTQKYR